MIIDKIENLDLKEIQDIYCEYLQTQNLSPNTIRTSRNDAFYLYKNDDTIDFWNLLKSDDFENLAYNHLYSTLDKNSKGNVKSNITGYMSHIRKFRNFVYSDSNIQVSSLASKQKTTVIPKKSPNTAVVKIPTPSTNQVEKYLESWNTLENYSLQENALNKLFFNLAPANTDISDVLIKAATLNDFYSTNIFSIFPVAKHILSLNIDDRLHLGDETLVEDIKNVVINNKKLKLYSFATKYCSHHNPEDFPIYDTYVDKVLCFFRNLHGFSTFKNKELKNYAKFKSILLDFQNFYGLQSYSLKELDKFLWQFGKEYFPKNYKRNNKV